jgi:hypothetical protein
MSKISTSKTSNFMDPDEAPQVTQEGLDRAVFRVGRKPVERERVLDLVKSAIPALSQELEAELSSLEALADDTLWDMARSCLSRQESAQLESLNFKQKNEGLSDAERAAQSRLLYQYQRRMLVRATAAKLLKDRDHDISGLLEAE